MATKNRSPTKQPQIALRNRGAKIPKGRSERFLQNESPNLTATNKISQKSTSKQPIAKDWPEGLARKVDAESRRLQKTRFEAKGLAEVPVTSLSLQNRSLFQTVIPNRPSPAPRSAVDSFGLHGSLSEGEMMNEMFTDETRLSRWGRKLDSWAYPLKQFFVWITYNIYCILSVGTVDFKTSRFWKQWAYRYPPTSDGYDWFNIRQSVEETQRSGNVLYTKKRVCFNPETGYHETVTYTNLDDENLFRDRYPGETEGIDPDEFGKYHYLTPQEAVIKWLGEKIIKPVMICFKAVVAFWALVWFGMVIISVGHMYIAEFVELIVDIKKNGVNRKYPAGAGEQAKALWGAVGSIWANKDNLWKRNVPKILEIYGGVRSQRWKLW
ncbi:hypothetical protein ABW20_dc0100299 [Dactylellina cionopaga]|nr:hypothetical protein ABW20_dc0100299 [Dactylellina cionopaga]